jgi:lipoate-protein ligase B
MQFKTFDLGLVDYLSAWQFQKEVFSQVKNGLFKSALIFCQHHPVITLGRRADRKNILASEQELQNRRIPVYQTERGGDVTYHGPGQLLLYPILDLHYFKKDIHLFLRKLEQAIIEAIGELGVYAQRLPGLTGVWCGNKKIASIGVAIKNWISFHGTAINIKRDDLDNFSLIRPCGKNIIMTSVESVLGRGARITQVKEILTRRLENDQSSFA